MKRLLAAVVCGLSAFLMLLNTPSPAYGLRIAIQQPAPIGQRVARSDATVVGTVTSIEEKTVSASPYPGTKEKVEYYVATVKIEENINGAKGLTHIKVAFLAPPKEAQPIDPKDRPVRPIRRPVQQLPTLTKGQEAILFLHQHHAENFYVMAQFDDLLDKKDGTFKAAVEEAKTTAKVIDDPMKALKVEKKDERLAAACTLLTRYRTAPIGVDPSTVKQEDLSADESKLILTALADADWMAKLVPDPGGFQPGLTTPLQCFQALNVTEKDGFKYDGVSNFQEVAHKWVKDNAEKYRIKKYVAADKK